jgi:septum formation protein
MNLILASQSTARAALLRQLGVPFTTQPADVDETPLKNEAPLAYVKRIALAKATAISAKNPGSVVLAADTPVIVGRRILQTPATPEEATAMLRLQSGRRVSIPTVVAVADATGKVHVKAVNSWIKFKRFTETEISTYIAAGHWQHISGAMDDSKLGHWFVQMSGSPTGITGLPLYETSLLLTRAGLKVNPFA